MNSHDWKVIRAILTIGGVALCVETAICWHDRRAVLINIAGALILAVTVLCKRRARRIGGAR